ncbi:MAG TPA: dihydrodipicolinate synthase family protein [Candidatus Rubrimentiphilum sp.]|nr:dihydrodipicolinate synthase family protein [Candidatus Rubrimentiphilum sp.]
MNATTLAVRLPDANGTITSYRLSGRSSSEFATARKLKTRVAFAAAHVVADPLAGDPLVDPRLDWERTLAFRHYLWSLGLGVAEAMDTAQRGMGLSWPLTQELVDRSLREAKTVGGLITCGAGTDQLNCHREASGCHPEVSRGLTLDRIIEAYLEQLDFIESRGGSVILMCSRALCKTAQSSEDYEIVYDRVIAAAKRPVILHWLGAMFDPQLEGYWGSRDLTAAAETVKRIIARHAPKIDGIKISLLDASFEVAFRREIPKPVRVYTGDDFNYPELIAGDEQGHSDALLGVFAAIAPAASAALAARDRGDRAAYDLIFAPTVPLARAIFEAPTYAYKAGIVFLAYLNGHQNHFRMVGGLESARSIEHLARVFQLADAAALLADPERAVARMKPVLELAGCP